MIPERITEMTHEHIAAIVSLIIAFSVLGFDIIEHHKEDIKHKWWHDYEGYLIAWIFIYCAAFGAYTTITMFIWRM